MILKMPEVDVIGTVSPVSAEGQVRQRLSEQVWKPFSKAVEFGVN